MAPGRSGAPFQRLRVVVVLLVPVAVSLFEAGRSALRPDGAAIGCWVLPNASVSFSGALDPGCPLRAYERIVHASSSSIAVPIQHRDQLLPFLRSGGGVVVVSASRGGQRRAVSIPIFDEPTYARISRFVIAAAFSGLLSILALTLVTRAEAPAAIPIALISGLTAAYLVGVLCPGWTRGYDVSRIVVQAVAPATVVHLALVFPRRRRIVERASGVLTVVYVLAACLATFEVSMILRNNALWEVADRIVGMMVIASASCLGVAGYLTTHESDSARERVEALVLMVGSGLVVAVITLLSVGVGSSLPTASRRTIATATILLLALITYLVTRYGLVDIPRAVRWGASYVVYTAVVAGPAFGGLMLARPWLPPEVAAIDPALFFGAVFVTLVVLERLRRASWGAVESWVTPWSPKLEALRARHARQSATAEDADAAIRTLTRTLVAGLEPRGAAAFLRLAGTGWRLASAEGEAPLHGGAASTAAELLEASDLMLRSGSRVARGVLYIDQIPGQSDPRVRLLRECGVGLVCGLRSGEALLGLVLLAFPERSWMLSSDHIAFVDQACAQASLAIHNARLHDEVLASTRMAAIGHAAAGLAHDLGRPIGEIFVEADPRSSTAAEIAPAGRLSTIRSLAGECLDQLERFAAEGKQAGSLPTGVARLPVVLEGAADRMAHLRDGRRPVMRMAPDLPMIPDGRSLQRVVENLLENAFEWTRPEDPVELCAAADRTSAVIRVIDRGAGMVPDVAERAFEPFYSRRSGTGIGLTSCQDIVRGLGGHMEMYSIAGKGTEVRVAVPHMGRGT
jgi:signal transduction histidine kinase